MHRIEVEITADGLNLSSVDEMRYLEQAKKPVSVLLD
jgi:hypothetical protein